VNTIHAVVGNPTLTDSYKEDLKLAASKMLGSERRSFHAAMTVKYCEGNSRQAEVVFGWNRHTVELGLNERRTGVVCLGAHSMCSGNKLWEEKHPEAARALWELAESHSQQDPTFRTTRSFTRLTAASALKNLVDLGFAAESLPSPSTMANALNRNGYRLRPVLKAKPQKKSPKRMRSSTISRKKTDKGLTEAISNA
jgi:Rhodopirellula transposase DDE domain